MWAPRPRNDETGPRQAGSANTMTLTNACSVGRRKGGRHGG
jgi:hypothetical protein